MKRILTMPVIAATAIALTACLVAWVLRPETSASPEPVAEKRTTISRDPSADDLGESTELRAQRLPIRNAESSTSPRANRMRVESDLGLILEHINVCTSTGEIRREDLVSGYLTLDATDAMAVSAPGHEWEKLAQGVQEVRLRSCSGHIVHGSGLRDALSGVDVMSEVLGSAPEISQCVTSGFVTGERWAIAYDPTMLRKNFGANQLDVTMRFSNWRRAVLERKFEVVGTIESAVPPEFLAPNGSRRDVEVTMAPKPGMTNQALDIVLWTARETEARVLRNDEAAWGSLKVYGSAPGGKQVLLPPGVCRFADVPLGSELGVYARSTESGAYARKLFVHDGSTVTLELQEPLRFRVLVTDAADRPISGSARISAVFHNPDGANKEVDEIAWMAAFDQKLTGEPLIATAPRKIPLTPLASISCPTLATITFAVPGFEDEQHTLTLVPGEIVDAGTVRMRPTNLTAPIVLLDTKPKVLVGQLLIAEHGTGQYEYRILGVFAENDRAATLQLRLEHGAEAGRSAALLEGLHDASGRITALRIAVPDQAGAWHYCDATGAGQFQELTTVRHQIQMRRAPTVPPLRYGVRWFGLSLVVGVVTTQEPVPTLAVSAPELGSQLWWQSIDPAGNGATGGISAVPLIPGTHEVDAN